jgi:hypothetical protein
LGGAIRVEVSNTVSVAKIVNNVLYDVITPCCDTPVGIYVAGTVPVYVANNIFGGFGGYSVYGAGGGQVTAEYNCNSGNNYGGGVTQGAGTITSNPIFVNSDAWDFRLQAGSPCINAGNPDASYNDMDGTRNDMGIFGGRFSTQRQIRVVSAIGAVGRTAMVPVRLAAMGDENSLSFSVTYDSTFLSNPQVSLGSNVTHATLVVNTRQKGRVGVWLYLDGGQTFAAGDLDLVHVAFAISASAPVGDTPIVFTDIPTRRDLADAQGNSLSAIWTDGLVNVIGDGDSDGDGMSDRDEVIAGTDLADSNSCFRIKIPTSDFYMPNGDEVIVHWYSASNRVYHLKRSTNLNSEFYRISPTNIRSTPPLNVHTDSTATGIGPYFYKVGVEQR